MNRVLIKDSIALYTLTIKIKGYKKGKAYKIESITSNDSLCYKLFPKIELLLNKIDFSFFVKAQGFNQIIIPVAIVLTAHDRLPKNANINIWDIPKKLNTLFDKEDGLRYQSVYTNPISIMLDNQIYN